MWTDYRWEYSPLARLGNRVWVAGVEPVLCSFSGSELAALRSIRGVVQISVLLAIVLLPLSLFYKTSHILNASGLLFDIAGILRLFLLEQVEANLKTFTENKYGNLPSVAMRELVMPEASGPYDSDSDYIKRFYYHKRGVLFLFLGFVLQMIANFIGMF